MVTVVVVIYLLQWCIIYYIPLTPFPSFPFPSPTHLIHCYLLLNRWCWCIVWPPFRPPFFLLLFICSPLLWCPTFLPFPLYLLLFAYRASSLSPGLVVIPILPGIYILLYTRWPLHSLLLLLTDPYIYSPHCWLCCYLLFIYMGTCCCAHLLPVAPWRPHCILSSFPFYIVPSFPSPPLPGPSRSHRWTNRQAVNCLVGGRNWLIPSIHALSIPWPSPFIRVDICIVGVCCGQMVECCWLSPSLGHYPFLLPALLTLFDILYLLGIRLVADSGENRSIPPSPIYLSHIPLLPIYLLHSHTLLIPLLFPFTLLLCPFIQLPLSDPIHSHSPLCWSAPLSSPRPIPHCQTFILVEQGLLLHSLCVCPYSYLVCVVPHFPHIARWSGEPHITIYGALLGDSDRWQVFTHLFSSHTHLHSPYILFPILICSLTHTHIHLQFGIPFVGGLRPPLLFFYKFVLVIFILFVTHIASPSSIYLHYTHGICFICIPTLLFTVPHSSFAIWSIPTHSYPHLLFYIP